MFDLQVWHSPALIAHIVRHDTQTLCLELTIIFAPQHLPDIPESDHKIPSSDKAALLPIEKRWEDQAFSMEIGFDEQHRASDTMQADKIALTTEIAEV